MFRGYAKFPGVGIRAMPVAYWSFDLTRLQFNKNEVAVDDSREGDGSSEEAESRGQGGRRRWHQWCRGDLLYLPGEPLDLRPHDCAANALSATFVSANALLAQIEFTKTMQQLSTQNVSAMEVVKNTLRNRGVFGLYKVRDTRPNSAHAPL